MPAKIKNLLKNFWLQIAVGFLLLEIISFAVFPHLWLSRLAYVLILIIAGWLTARKLEYGAYLLLAELIVGGFGYLVFFPLSDGRASLRLGLFIIVGLIWLIQLIRQQDFAVFKDRRLIPLAIFFAVCCWSALNGYLAGHPLMAIFSDLNGYLYLGLIGLFLSIKLEPFKAMQIFLVGSVILGLKTLAVLFIFSHGYALVGPALIYHWIRDTGVGEITLIFAPLYRIFFQSQFYNLLALIASAYILLIRTSEAGQANAVINSINQSKPARLALWLLAWFNFYIIVISQSRSFWVAGLFALIILLPLVAWQFKVAWQRIIVYLVIIPAYALTANFAGQAIIGDFQTDFFSGRVGGSAGSAGVSSRMAELAPALALIKQTPLLGQGFGATIRFRSDDPRIKTVANPEGWTDAVAIEWGYLDLAVKTGILGLVVYLAFLLFLAWPLLQSVLKYNLLATGLLIGLLTLMIIHIFTPYLNHPLGIGYLLATVALTKKSSS